MTAPDGPPPRRPPPRDVDATLALLAEGRYVADRGLATSLYLALALGRPLLLEGDAGVGKTEVARVLARALGRTLLRLQCYEGLDLASAAYEWNYPRQLLEIRLAEGSGGGEAERRRLAAEIYTERFLIKRPLVRALEPDEGGPPVLLVDELDRADEPFEAFLLELLGDFQITIPELGTLRASEPPAVIITSNRTREIHDALKRRCLYHWVGHPDAARELAIVRARAPEAPEALGAQIVDFVQRLRREDLFKPPGVAETLDWARALLALERRELDPDAVDATLGVLLKYQDDIAAVAGPKARSLVEAARAGLPAAGDG
ncbi:MAG TPA: MoxR family ATPase [Polyangiaceae bacterium]|nr:MoxR family ATPase [Polyangiaceae bacterium]